LYRASFATPGELHDHAAGVLIVDEAQPVLVDRDLLLTLDHGPLASGAHVTLNGAPAADLSVRAHERLRLRVVNAALSRALALRIERHAVWVMAIDGQPAEPFLARDGRVVLAPGNRVDLFVDAALTPGESAQVTIDDATPIARLVYESTPPVRAALLAEPQPLPPNPLPERLDFKGAQRQDLELQTLMRLPSPAPARPPLFSVRRGRTVVLALANRADTALVVHPHGHHVRLLDRLDDGWKPFWLDTIMVAAGRTERIAFLADNPGKWLIEARALGQPPAGTLGWFRVS
jgi:FtsP/CotA-like multicopper oxidase with cupredoxin domain